MNRLWRWAGWCLPATLLASATPSGCASPGRPAAHEDRLLDHKVTAERIHAALRRAGPRFRDVAVAASRERITLTGTVASAEARTRAEAIARDVDPTVKLDDEVSVR